jgi:ATP phosphoribosyltransferase regulatory subunit
MTETPADVRTQAERLTAAFTAAGAQRIEAAALQPAETLLDLYGEDIRTRAYVTFDPAEGEMMLRPDFTVPVVKKHMQGGAEPARYTYQGPVWRKQDAGAGRHSEVLQVGFELFDRENPAQADAEVFALFTELLAGRGLRAATGDLGILKAAIDGLDTLARRKAALARHIWRPVRFRALLDRFGGTAEVPQSRQLLLAAAAESSAQTLIAKAGVAVGLRSLDEIKARVAALQQDAAAPPIAGEQVLLLEEILTLRKKSPAALEHLQGLARTMPALTPAIRRMEARLEALAAKGVDVTGLDFEGSYGRTTMEYYDGFVFGFYAGARPDLPVIASGGRYDALTAVLGGGRSIPAVGGVIRPEFLLALAEGGA